MAAVRWCALASRLLWQSWKVNRNDLLWQKEVLVVPAYTEKPFRKDVLKLGEEGLRSLYRILFGNLEQKSIDLAQARHRKITVPASAYVSGVIPSKLDGPKGGGALIEGNTNLRLIQRVVASERFTDLQNVDLILCLSQENLLKVRSQMIEEDIVAGFQGSGKR